jgi:hypothetical protein
MRRPTLALLLFITVTLRAQGNWPLAKSQPIVDKTETIRLAPDLSRLSAGEQQAVSHLLDAGRLMQELYEIQLHHQASKAGRELAQLSKEAGTASTKNLELLYRLFHGPVATTLENKREPFLAVDPPVAGKNVYPWGITKESVEAFLASRPEQRDRILAERTVVRRATAENLASDLKTFATHPSLETLHAGTKVSLDVLAAKPDSTVLYAVPYPVAYAERLFAVHRLLNLAADSVESADAEFAGYLRNRARDVLTNDYESGDAAWVTGRFGKLNLQIGAYETYDDALYGVKAFHSASILLRNDQETERLKTALGSLQGIENALPYDHHKRVRADIPVGVYEVIADFGQARGTNTATILPNDPLYSRRYGRTILLRENIMRNSSILAAQKRAWDATVGQPFEDDLGDSGDFYRTLWHEVGHYLGVDRDKRGRTLDLALEDYADSIEELKSDLVSLFALDILAKKGLFDQRQLRGVQAAGILRTLQNNQPRADQPYQRMQLIQFNYFLERGLLTHDSKAGALMVDYSRCNDTVTSLLRQVLDLQHAGDTARAKAFYEKYTAWRPELHGAIAKAIRDSEGPRFRLVRYAALGE